MKRLLGSFFLCLLVVFFPFARQTFVSARFPKDQAAIKKLVNDFISADWQKVHVAESALESRQAESIPALIEILDQDERVELHNTADLIYPGAKEFYGHGWILDYDVDWLSVRAGWALEELTFQNFGFREGAISEANLFQAAVKGQKALPVNENAPHDPDVKKRRRAEAVARAKSWWRKTNGSWNRFDALLEALRSDDSIRQFWTVSWLRNGKTRCDGLNMESFEKYILPEAKRLAQSKDENVRDQVKYLLEDKEGWWLKNKAGEKD